MKKSPLLMASPKVSLPCPAVGREFEGAVLGMPRGAEKRLLGLLVLLELGGPGFG